MTSLSCVVRRYNQFLMWTDIKKERISRFTQAHKEPLHKEACVLVATYNMITHSGARTRPTEPSFAQTRLAKPKSKPNV